MAYKNVSKDYWNYDNETSETKLKTLKNRLAVKKAQLEDVQYEYDLEHKALFNAYKEHITYDMMFINCFAQKAQKWLGCLERNEAPDGEKLDKRRSYDEKESYNYVVDKLKKIFNREDIELIKIYDYNFSEAWEYIFRCENTEFIFIVPDVQKVSFQSFQHDADWCFRIRLGYYKDKHVSNTFFSTFDEEEGLDKALENKLKELKSTEGA